MKPEDEVDRDALLWMWPHWPGPLFRYATPPGDLPRGSLRTRAGRMLVNECSGEINSNAS